MRNSNIWVILSIIALAVGLMFFRNFSQNQLIFDDFDELSDLYDTNYYSDIEDEYIYTADSNAAKTSSTINISNNVSDTSEVKDKKTIKADIIASTVADMKSNSKIKKGMKVYTEGFYSKDDGGASYYTITNDKSSVNEITHIKLNNGLVAELVLNDRMNVKQFGAKGDGSSDDYTKFDAAISSLANTIYIPAGTYEINNHFITLNKFVNLIGEAGTVIKHGGFKSKYGISVDSIIFDGGAKTRIDYLGTSSLDEDGTIVFIVSPHGEVDVTYKNSTFKNVTIASYAKDEGELPKGSKIKNNVVENCTFKDIGKVAIYHNLTLGSGTYINNTFSDIGNNSLLQGFVGALFLGDITNITEKEADSIVIKNSTFKNLITKDDFEKTVHAINANFIAIKADKAVVDNNTFTNLAGYGNDREGIYTKVRDLTISNNRLSNAGLGEGYICAKAHVGNTFSTIINNTFEGYGGTPIRSYTPGKISGNKINTSNVYTAITNTISNKITTANHTLIISDNTFKAGTSSTLNVGGRVITDYNKNNMISLSSVTVPIIIENNIIETSTNFAHYISSGSQSKSLTVRNNNFNLPGKTGVGIFVFSSEADTLNSDVLIEGNNFNVSADFIPARTRMFNHSGTSSKRTVTFTSNNMVFAGTDSVTTLMCQTSENNNDHLIINKNTVNRTKEKASIVNDFKYLENDDFSVKKTK